MARTFLKNLAAAACVYYVCTSYTRARVRRIADRTFRARARAHAQRRTEADSQGWASDKARAHLISFVRPMFRRPREIMYIVSHD